MPEADHPLLEGVGFFAGKCRNRLNNAIGVRAGPSERQGPDPEGTARRPGRRERQARRPVRHGAVLPTAVLQREQLKRRRITLFDIPVFYPKPKGPTATPTARCTTRGARGTARRRSAPSPRSRSGWRTRRTSSSRFAGSCADDGGWRRPMACSSPGGRGGARSPPVRFVVELVAEARHDVRRRLAPAFLLRAVGPAWTPTRSSRSGWPARGWSPRSARGLAEAAACPASDFARDAALLALAARAEDVTREAYDHAVDAGDLRRRPHRPRRHPCARPGRPRPLRPRADRPRRCRARCAARPPGEVARGREGVRADGRAGRGGGGHARRAGEGPGAGQDRAAPGAP